MRSEASATGVPMNPSDGQTIELLQTQQSFVEGAKLLDTQLTGRERDQVASPRKMIVLCRGRSPRGFSCFFELIKREMKGMRHGPILGAENVRAVHSTISPWVSTYTGSEVVKDALAKASMQRVYS